MSYVNNYRYTLQDRLGTKQVYPLSEADFILQWTREAEGKRYYRQELPSKIFFKGDAFNRLFKIERSIYRCGDIGITVERRCVTNGVSNWIPTHPGIIQLNSGSWDLDRCQVEIQLSEDQTYSCIENNKSKEINLMNQVSHSESVNLFPTTSTIEKKSVSVTYTTNRPGGCSDYAWDETYTAESQGWAVYYNQVYNDYVPGSPKPPGSLYFCQVTTRYARQKTVVNCGDPSPGAEWTLILDSCGFPSPPYQKIYAKPVSVYGCKITLANPDNPAYNFNNTYECKIVGDTADGEPVVVDNGMNLGDILTTILSNACTGITVKSDFFQINPDNVSLINYVTGARSTTDRVLVFQKSDVKRPGVSGNASQAKTTIEKILTALTLMYNCAWRFENDPVTDGVIFRIEHVKYFTPGIGLDLMQPKYAKYVKSKRRYTYTTEKIPAREVFTFMEAFGADFVGLPIVYNSGCVTNTQDNVKTNTVEGVTTDVELCLSNADPDSTVVSDDGLVFIASRVDGNGVPYILSETPIIAGSILNNPFSWAHLHRDYYMYERPVKFGNLNGQDVEFISTLPTKRGEKISIPFCCGDVFNPEEIIIGPLGMAVVDKATFSFKDETIEFDLLYTADDNLVNNQPPTVTDKVFTMYANQDIDIDILAGYTDTDPGATVTEVIILNAPAHGTAIVLPNKKIRYTPAPGYSGDDMFIFKILDDWSEPSNAALVAGTIYPPNQSPIAGNVNYSGFKNTQFSKEAPGLLVNSIDDHSFSLYSYDAVSVHGGTVVVNPDGSFTYNPASGFYGSDSFTFTIIDSQGATGTATVNINVVNPDIPNANADSYQTRKNNSLTIAAPGLLNNDTTLTGTLSVIAETKATTHGGSVIINSNGSFTYTPPAGYVGHDSFNYTITNGIATATSTADLNNVPDVWAHIAQIGEVTTSETTNCDGSDLNKGSYVKTAIQRLSFYSDAGGTVPLDLTGVGMKFKIKQGAAGATGPGSPIGPYNYSTFEIVVSGFTYDFTAGINGNIVHKEIFNCSATRVSYDDYIFAINPGDYEII